MERKENNSQRKRPQLNIPAFSLENNERVSRLDINQLADKEGGMEEICDMVIGKMKDLQLNFLALDFDLTVLSIHTGGKRRDPNELERLLRPLFRLLIPKAVENEISVAIVTFSPRVQDIRDVLYTAFGEEVARKIPIRGEDGGWEPPDDGTRDGKQAHMASAVDELAQTMSVHITRATTLLVDDDLNNISIALAERVRAVWLNPNMPNGWVEEVLAWDN
mmetsp:Transcript_8055/g.12341  ORF Transcript_8055/g.12341 Transcript_8055/m.12341 type:complete len:220 (-) Transcript_8055:346-1005(-)|eukprot:CAMPEP_0113937626 /NCGR_PEP_ID=MMETSP1339-20121228/4208_1 /TAXON_ID=94617 /ORGANISM="Fibrocapsa japonica" /LENGTH=219 /DNA_ID=CAMNT_0000940469 /DNA_START=182 /DNA_END=841 /DNA_ORIENTATION=- /assembly_acc=CAM_ASM_000762